MEARKRIYLPAYQWVLDNPLADLVAKLAEMSEDGTVVLLDYKTNDDVEDTSKPLSHASLIVQWIKTKCCGDRFL